MKYANLLATKHHDTFKTSIITQRHRTEPNTPFKSTPPRKPECASVQVNRTMHITGHFRINKLLLCVSIVSVITLIIITFHYGTANRVTRYYQSGGHPDELVDLKQLLIASINAAVKGGVEVVSVSRQDDIHMELKGKTKEGAPDRVTDADLRSHCIMHGEINEKVQIVSEEHVKCEDRENGQIIRETPLDLNDFHLIDTLKDAYAMRNDVVVWMDPLDATQEFTEKLYEYVTTAVCIAVNGEPTMGVVYKPFTNELSWAWKNVAMSENLKDVVKTDALKTAKIVMSRSHTGAEATLNKLKMKFNDDVEIVRAAGSNYKALEVIHGRADAYVHVTAIKKWDLCAANALVDSLGGALTTMNGKRIDYGNVTDVLNRDGVLASVKYYDWFASRLVGFLDD